MPLCTKSFWNIWGCICRPSSFYQKSSVYNLLLWLHQCSLSFHHNECIMRWFYKMSSSYTPPPHTAVPSKLLSDSQLSSFRLLIDDLSHLYLLWMLLPYFWRYLNHCLPITGSCVCFNGTNLLQNLHSEWGFCEMLAVFSIHAYWGITAVLMFVLFLLKANQAILLECSRLTDSHWSGFVLYMMIT